MALLLSEAGVADALRGIGGSGVKVMAAAAASKLKVLCSLLLLELGWFELQLASRASAEWLVDIVT